MRGGKEKKKKKMSLQTGKTEVLLLRVYAKITSKIFFKQSHKQKIA